MVNAAAVLVGIVRLKTGSTPIVCQCIAERGWIVVYEGLPNAVDERPARVRRYIRRHIVARDGIANVTAAERSGTERVINLAAENRPA